MADYASPESVPPDAESTFVLLDRANAGDSAALDLLFARYLKPLQRWASGRLPAWARAAADTHDLVQDTLLNAFKKIGSFEPKREGAFQAYLRQAVMNRLRDQLRRVQARQRTESLADPHDEIGVSPLDHAIGMEMFERYEAALSRLSTEEQEAIIGRVEMENTYDELAKNLGKPSGDAARMAVTRALVRLAEEMQRGAQR